MDLAARLQIGELDLRGAEQGVASQEPAFVHHLHLGHAAFEDPEAGLVFSIERHDHGVVVLRVVGLLHDDAAVLEGILLRVGKLESGKKKEQLRTGVYTIKLYGELDKEIYGEIWIS